MKFTKAQLACIKSLEDRHGRISAPRMLAEARQPKSPLHSLKVFDGWDRTRASEKRWLHCCRLVIGAVVYVETHNHKEYSAIGYVVDPSSDGYRSVAALKTDPPSARDALVYTLEVASGHIRRAYELAVPLGLGREVDALLAQVAGVQRIAKGKKAA